MSGVINFNFTPEQEVEYNRILKVSKIEYPQFFTDPINEYRIKVIIANNVILGDDEFGKQFCNDKEQVIIEE
jgi:hypothetical protein